jgi:hypothetical protein
LRMSSGRSVVNISIGFREWCAVKAICQARRLNWHCSKPKFYSSSSVIQGRAIAVDFKV